MFDFWLINDLQMLIVGSLILDSSHIPEIHFLWPTVWLADLLTCRLTCECLETQCRSTLRTLLVAARRMMNSLSQVFSVVLKPKQRRERHFTG